MARMGDRRGAYRVFVGDLRERDHLEDLDIGGYNIKMDLQKSGVKHKLD